MKHLLLPILFALSFGAAAQKIHFTDTSNRWTVRHDYYNELSGKTTIDYETWALRDTIVLGENVMYFTNNEGSATHAPEAYFQEDTVNNIILGKYIEWENPDSFKTKTLYDFSIDAGDSFEVNFGHIVCNEIQPDVSIESLPYRVFTTSHHFSGPYIIESIGGLGGPFSTWVDFDEYLVGLTCFEHKGVQVTFSDYFANDCEILSIDEKGKQSINLSLFPNPADGYINIESANTINRMSLLVFDILGREMHRGNLQNATKIDISTWADGIYMVHVNDEQGNISINRFTKR